MTMLDQNRASAQLAEAAQVPVTAVEQLFIWGNHSATQYPDIHHAMIAGQPVTQVIEDKAWLEKTFIETVQQRGAAIIQARGASSAASAASAVIDTVRHLTGQEGGRPFSVACYSSGEYGAKKGLIVSYPCQVDSAGVLHILTDLEHNTFSREKIMNSLIELQQEYEVVEQMGLLN